jgi:O-antigen ligase/tetratricopeptide (TPR) repeat protein
MENIIPEKYYKFFLYGILAVLILPVINIQPWVSPPAWGKTILFRIVFSILLCIFIRQAIIKRKSTNLFDFFKKVLLDKKNALFWIFWLIISFIFIILLSTIFSQDPAFSFWGSPQRAGGSLNLISYILFAILCFLIIKERDWPKIWLFAFGTGFLVSLIAIFQRLRLFSSILIPQTDQAISTMGSPIILGLYLTLLVFASLSFAIKNTGIKRFFYFLCFILFASNLLLTGSRASALGFIICLPFFIFFFPENKSRKIKLFKIIAAGLFVLGILGLFWLINSQITINGPISRIIGASRPFFDLKNFSPGKIISDNRPSGWNIAIEGIKEKPLLGFGPENFSILYDKYYNSSYADLGVNSWWDRAHSFVFEIAATSGIPSLIIYLSIFGLIFWQLQKIKYRDNCNNAVIIHGIQTALLAYFTSLLFGFDDFSTYQILFVITSYSFFIILKSNPIQIESKAVKTSETPLWKSALSFCVLCTCFIFVWLACLKPLFLNKEINLATHYARSNECKKATEIMDKNISSHSFLDAYFRLSYVDILTTCSENNPNQKLALSLKLNDVLKETINLMPTYTRIWWFLGSNARLIIGNEKSYTQMNIKIDIEQLKKDADEYFKKTLELSPKRWTVFQDWASTKLTSGNYEGTIEKSEECIVVEPQASSCYWSQALAYISLGQIEKGELLKKITVESGFATDEEKALNAYAQAYSKALELQKTPQKKEAVYLKLKQIYIRLIEHSNNFKYHATLAFVYKELKDYNHAADEAIAVFALNPGSLSTIEEFIDSLPQSQLYYNVMIEKCKLLLAEGKYKEPEQLINHPELEGQYRGTLAFLYFKTGNYVKAKEEALILKKLRPESALDIETFIKSLK